MKTFVVALTALLLALTGCSDDDPPADSGATPDVAQTPDSKVTKPDGKVTKPDSQIAKPDSKIAKPDAGSGACTAKPSGYCKLSDAPCVWASQTCKCLNVCGGVKPPPGKEYAWKCTPPLPAGCPPKPPANGAKCGTNGLQCVYGHCPATRANCIGGVWQVKTDPLPP